MSDAIKNGFTARQVGNGGWIVSTLPMQDELRIEIAAFTSPAEMLGWLRDYLVNVRHEEKMQEIFDEVRAAPGRKADRIPTDIGDGAGPL